MLIIKVNKKRKEHPVCWDEVTTLQYQRLKSATKLDLLRAFCIMVDEPFDLIAETRSDEIEAVLYQCTAFIVNEPESFRDNPHTDKIRLRGKVIEVPRKLGSLTLEQNMQLRAAIADPDTVCLEQLISLAVSVYLQPLVDGGRFNYDKAMDLKEEIERMPITQTFAVGFFFLSKLNNFGSSGLLYWLLKKMRILKLKMKSRKRLMLIN